MSAPGRATGTRSNSALPTQLPKPFRRRASDRHRWPDEELNTYKHNRSMQEAFGPYTDHRLHPIPAPKSRMQKLADCVFATVIGVLGAAMLVHWLAQ
jgi:hypothetical protein